MNITFVAYQLFSNKENSNEIFYFRQNFRAILNTTMKHTNMLIFEDMCKQLKRTMSDFYLNIMIEIT